MSAAAQRGYTLPEVLATLALLALMLGAIGESLLPRLELAQAGAERAERERVAALVARARDRGRLAAGATLPSQLRQALPGMQVPATIGGLPYRFLLDHDDPRLLSQERFTRADGTPGTREITTRAPLAPGALRVPHWRQRLLRAQAQAAP